MDMHLLGKEDVYFEENGHRCDFSGCDIPATRRYHDGRDGYVYGCDHHEEWAQRAANRCTCDECRTFTNRPRVWHELDERCRPVELMLCPDCWRARYNDNDEEDLVDENPYAWPEDDDE